MDGLKKNNIETKNVDKNKVSKVTERKRGRGKDWNLSGFDKYEWIMGKAKRVKKKHSVTSDMILNFC